MSNTSARRPALQSAAAGNSITALPIALFGSVMGLTGLALAWRAAQEHFGAPAWVAGALGGIAMLVFIFMTVAYMLKAASAPGAVHTEFTHPIAGNMFGTPLISLLLLPMLLADIGLLLARAIWTAGAIGMVIFAWFSVSRWMRGEVRQEHLTPAWIVPVVGMIDIPLALPALQWQSLHGVMMFSLAVGLFFALPLLTLILSRLIFQEKMPPALQPTLMIMVAPFSVGYSSYVITTGRFDDFAQALYMLMLFMLAVLSGRLLPIPGFLVGRQLPLGGLGGRRFALRRPRRQ